MQSVVKMNESTNQSVVEYLHDFVNFGNMFNHVVVIFVFDVTPQIAFGVMDIQSLSAWRSPLGLQSDFFFKKIYCYKQGVQGELITLQFCE